MDWTGAEVLQAAITQAHVEEAPEFMGGRNLTGLWNRQAIACMARAPPPLLALQNRIGQSSLARLPAKCPELRTLRLLAEKSVGIWTFGVKVPRWRDEFCWGCHQTGGFQTLGKAMKTNKPKSKFKVSLDEDHALQMSPWAHALMGWRPWEAALSANRARLGTLIRAGFAASIFQEFSWVMGVQARIKITPVMASGFVERKVTGNLYPVKLAGENVTPLHIPQPLRRGLLGQEDVEQFAATFENERQWQVEIQAVYDRATFEDYLCGRVACIDDLIA